MININTQVFNLNLLFVFQSAVTPARDRYIQKKNLVLTNHLSQFECLFPRDFPRFIDLRILQMSLLKLKYFMKGFSANTNSILIYTDTPTNFALVKYFSWRFGCCYSLGWYRGLYSNARFVRSLTYLRGINYRFCFFKRIDFFFLLDSQPSYSSLQVQNELNTSGGFIFSFNTSFDNFSTDFYFFTSKFSYQLYYYLNILFCFFCAELKSYSHSLFKKTSFQNIRSTARKTALWKKKMIQINSAKIYKTWKKGCRKKKWRAKTKFCGVSFVRACSKRHFGKLRARNRRFVKLLRLQSAKENILPRTKQTSLHQSVNNKKKNPRKSFK